MLPSLVLENQFGEVSNNFIKGGSSQLRAKFVVDNTNADGITGLVAQGIAAVYMHTATTPSAGNPNPLAGLIQVEFEKGFSSYQSLAYSAIPPQSGSSLLVASAGLTAGQVYVITVLGTTSQAQWEVLGVPHGVTAALGVTFIALATSCTGTGAVQIPVVGGTTLVSINPVGNPSKNIQDDDSGAVVILACYKAGGTVAAPTFTGAAHSHNLLVKGGQAASTTNDVAVYTDVLGKEQVTDATILGVDSATKGGVIAATAGGSNSAPAFTGALAVGAPVAGTIIELCFSVIPVPAPLI